MKKTSRDVIILNLCNKKTYDVCLLTYGVLARTFFFLSFQAIFCFFTPLLTPQINKLKFGKTVKKHLDILSFYRCVPLIKIIWCMVPEIWSSTGKFFLSSWANFFCHLGQFFVLLSFSFLKISKMKKNPGDIIILHKCTKNHDHLLYCSRDMAHEGCNCYFHFGLSDIFPSTFLPPVNSRKNSILNWVMELNLIKLPIKFYSSKKNCCLCRQTMCRLCFCSQRECRNTFSSNMET